MGITHQLTSQMLPSGGHFWNWHELMNWICLTLAVKQGWLTSAKKNCLWFNRKWSIQNKKDIFLRVRQAHFCMCNLKVGPSWPPSLVCMGTTVFYFQRFCFLMVDHTERLTQLIRDLHTTIKYNFILLNATSYIHRRLFVHRKIESSMLHSSVSSCRYEIWN